MENNLQMQPRNIEIITAEIREISRQVRNMALMYVIEIGRRLIEAKSALPFGEWSKWLREEVGFSQSSAINYMKLFEEYGDAQISVFGAVSNSQTIGNLPYSKALQLLSLPADERETFAEEVDAEHISVRELKEAIAEKNAALEAKEKAEERERAALERADAAEAAAADLQKAENEVSDLEETVAALKKSIEDAEAAAKAAEEKYKDAVKNPKIPASQLKKIKAEAEAAAEAAAEKKQKAAIDKVKKELEDAEDRLKVAQRAKAESDAELQEAKAKLKAANPDVAAFKAIFEEIQKSAKVLKTKIAVVQEYDAETAEKLQQALSAFGKSLIGG